MLAALLMLAGAGGAGQDAGPSHPPVLPGRALVFPQDLGAHPDHRTEWWYITGWLRDGQGGARLPAHLLPRAHPYRRGQPSRSRRASSARACRGGRSGHGPGCVTPSSSGRAYPGLVEALEATHGGAGGRLVSRAGTAQAAHRSRIEADDFGFTLDFAVDRAPVLNGREGYSQKAPDPLQRQLLRAAARSSR